MSKYRYILNLDLICRELLSIFDSGAIISSQNEVLNLKYETLADIGTLGPSASTVIKYFPMKMGDIVILNDPYSGGTTLSTLSIVTPLYIGSLSMGNLYLVVRTFFRPQLSHCRNLEEEGLRIPPTPIGAERKINKAVLKMILQHPKCPAGFENRLYDVLENVWRSVDSFQAIVEQNHTIFSKVVLQKYFDYTDKALGQSFNEWSHGDSKTELTLDGGELIRLRTYFDQEKILFDFSGTKSSLRMCLTDSATMGSCVGATLALFKQNLPINSGLFSHFQVVTPLGSLVNTKYPSPTFKGMTEGTSLIASIVINGISSIIAPNRIPMSAQSPALIQFTFSDGRNFFDSLAGGIGASGLMGGADSLHLWTRNKLRNSVQEIESHFPMRINQIGIRHASGGKGQFYGGNGLHKEYQLLEPAQLTWAIEQKKSPPQGTMGGAPGLPPEIWIYPKSGEKYSLPEEEGTLNLQEGDRVFVCTAGGGGFGR